MKPLIPYAMQVCMALLQNDKKKADKIIEDALADIAARVFDIAGEYEASDIVFVVASMQILTNAITPSLDEASQNVIKMLTENTVCVTMSKDILKSMMENGDGQE